MTAVKMEAVPRMPMLSFELKHCPESVEFTPALRTYIEDFYNEEPSHYNKECQEIDQLRQASVNVIRDFTGCSTLKKYYSQLHFLKSRFPLEEGGMLALPYTWNEVYSGKSVSIADIKYEEACILYNIGALHSLLGAVDNRQSPEGMKVSCTHFQCAAWAFNELRDHYPAGYSTDFNYDLLSFKNALMLAQAQECILEKSMNDNRKSTITAKIATQIVDYYKQSSKFLESKDGSSILGGKLCKDWKRRVDTKRKHYEAVMYLYLGNESQEREKWGESVAFLEAANTAVEEACKLAKDEKNDEMDATLAFTNDVIGGRYNSAKKDNSFVYHEKVPPLDTLPEVKGAALVKGIGFATTDSEISGQDIFRRLVPMAAHEASSLYSEEKAQLLRTMGGKIDQKNKELEQFVSSLGIDRSRLGVPTAGAEGKSEAKLPQKLLENCAQMSVKTHAIEDLKAAMTKLASKATDMEFSLTQVFTLLDEEQKAEAEFQKRFGKRGLNAVLGEIRKDAEKLGEGLDAASKSNLNLHQIMDNNITNLTHLTGPLDVLHKTLPSVATMPLSDDERTVVDEMRRLVDKVDEMKQQRTTLEQQLRAQVLQDDVTSALVIQEGQDQQEFFREQLKKHDEKVDLLEKNMAAQQNICRRLTEVNAKYAPVRKRQIETEAKREAMISELVASSQVLDDLLRKTSQGVQFYTSLEDNINRVVTRAQSVCKTQQEERDRMQARLQPKGPPPARPTAAKPGSAPPSVSTPEMPSLNLNEYDMDPKILNELAAHSMPGMSAARPALPSAVNTSASRPTGPTLADYLPFMKPKSFGSGAKKGTDGLDKFSAGAPTNLSQIPGLAMHTGIVNPPTAAGFSEHDGITSSVGPSQGTTSQPVVAKNQGYYEHNIQASGHGHEHMQAQGPIQSQGQMATHPHAPMQSQGQMPAHQQAPLQSQGQMPVHPQAPIQSQSHMPVHPQAPMQSQGQMSVHAQPHMQSQGQIPGHQQAPMQSQGPMQIHPQGPIQSQGQMHMHSHAPMQSQGQMPVHAQAPMKCQGQIPVHLQAPMQSQGQMPIHSQGPMHSHGQMPVQSQAPIQSQMFGQNQPFDPSSLQSPTAPPGAPSGRMPMHVPTQIPGGPGVVLPPTQHGTNMPAASFVMVQHGPVANVQAQAGHGQISPAQSLGSLGHHSQASGYSSGHGSSNLINNPQQPAVYSNGAVAFQAQSVSYATPPMSANASYANASQAYATANYSYPMASQGGQMHPQGNPMDSNQIVHSGAVILSESASLPVTGSSMPHSFSDTATYSSLTADLYASSPRTRGSWTNYCGGYLTSRYSNKSSETMNSGEYNCCTATSTYRRLADTAYVQSLFLYEQPAQNAACITHFQPQVPLVERNAQHPVQTSAVSYPHLYASLAAAAVDPNAQQGSTPRSQQQGIIPPPQGVAQFPQHQGEGEIHHQGPTQPIQGAGQIPQHGPTPAPHPLQGAGQVPQQQAPQFPAPQGPTQQPLQFVQQQQTGPQLPPPQGPSHHPQHPAMQQQQMSLAVPQQQGKIPQQQGHFAQQQFPQEPHQQQGQFPQQQGPIPQQSQLPQQQGQMPQQQGHLPQHGQFPQQQGPQQQGQFPQQQGPQQQGQFPQQQGPQQQGLFQQQQGPQQQSHFPRQQGLQQQGPFQQPHGPQQQGYQHGQQQSLSIKQHGHFPQQQGQNQFPQQQASNQPGSTQFPQHGAGQLPPQAQGQFLQQGMPQQPGPGQFPQQQGSGAFAQQQSHMYEHGVAPQAMSQTQVVSAQYSQPHQYVQSNSLPSGVGSQMPGISAATYQQPNAPGVNSSMPQYGPQPQQMAQSVGQAYVMNQPLQAGVQHGNMPQQPTMQHQQAQFIPPQQHSISNMAPQPGLGPSSFQSTGAHSVAGPVDYSNQFNYAQANSASGSQPQSPMVTPRPTPAATPNVVQPSPSPGGPVMPPQGQPVFPAPVQAFRAPAQPIRAALPEPLRPKPAGSLSSAASLDDILSSSPSSGFAGPPKGDVLVPQRITEDDIKQKKEEKLKTTITHETTDPYADPAKLKKLVQEAEEFCKLVDSLNRPEAPGARTPLDRIWRELSEEQERDSRPLSMAIARCYPMKNRFPDVMPYDATRVLLTDGDDDYINASHIGDLTPSCPKLIATQAPLASTCGDFWRLIYEQGCELIVMLSSPESERQHVYLPREKGETVQHGACQLSLSSVKHKANWTERIVTLTHKQKRNSRSVVHLEFKGWPPGGQPENVAGLLQFISEVHMFYTKQRSLMNAVVVHCSDGLGRTGAFCVVYAAVQEIEHGRGGQLQLASKISGLRMRRKWMVREKTHLLFCYQAVLHFVQDFLIKRGVLLSGTRQVGSSNSPVRSGTKPPPSQEDALFADAKLPLSAILNSVARLTLKERAEPDGGEHCTASFTSADFQGHVTKQSDHLGSQSNTPHIQKEQDAVMSGSVTKGTAVQHSTAPSESTFSSTPTTPHSSTPALHSHGGQVPAPGSSQPRSGPSHPAPVPSSSETSSVSISHHGASIAGAAPSSTNPQSSGNAPPLSLSDLQNPQTFALGEKGSPGNKVKTRRADFEQRTGALSDGSRSGGGGASTTDDPLSSLDPFWSLKKKN